MSIPEQPAEASAGRTSLSENDQVIKRIDYDACDLSIANIERLVRTATRGFNEESFTLTTQYRDYILKRSSVHLLLEAVSELSDGGIELKALENLRIEAVDQGRSVSLTFSGRHSGGLVLASISDEEWVRLRHHAIDTILSEIVIPVAIPVSVNAATSVIGDNDEISFDFRRGKPNLIISNVRMIYAAAQASFSSSTVVVSSQFKERRYRRNTVTELVEAIAAANPAENIEALSDFSIVGFEGNRSIRITAGGSSIALSITGSPGDELWIAKHRMELEAAITSISEDEYSYTPRLYSSSSEHVSDSTEAYGPKLDRNTLDKLLACASEATTNPRISIETSRKGHDYSEGSFDALYEALKRSTSPGDPARPSNIDIYVHENDRRVHISVGAKRVGIRASGSGEDRDWVKARVRELRELLEAAQRHRFASRTEHFTPDGFWAAVILLWSLIPTPIPLIALPFSLTLRIIIAALCVVFTFTLVETFIRRFHRRGLVEISLVDSPGGVSRATKKIHFIEAASLVLSAVSIALTVGFGALQHHDAMNPPQPKCSDQPSPARPSCAP